MCDVPVIFTVCHLAGKVAALVAGIGAIGLGAAALIGVLYVAGGRGLLPAGPVCVENNRPFEGCSTPTSTPTPSSGPQTPTRPNPSQRDRQARVRALCVGWS